MPAPITADLGAFVAALRFPAIPPAAIEIASLGFTDCIGCMIAGRVEPAPLLLEQVLQPSGAGATLYFSGRQASAPEAALINGTAAHALDYDDASLRGHPSVPMVSAILAEAEVLGASGQDMLTAYVAGYEVWADLVLREPGQYHMKGLHPTGIFGPIAAAAACASLRRLDAATAAQAIALGASQSAGLMSNFGSMTKPFHAGRAAQAGVMAARLAAAGFTASPDAIEHPQGFLSAYSPRGEADVEAPVQAGRAWRILEYGLSIKKYPMCFCTHKPIDALLDLQAAEAIPLSEIESVTVRMSGRNARVLRNHRPQTGLAAKFSIEFAMACGLLAGRVGLQEVRDEFVATPEIQALMTKVRVDPNPREDPLTGYAPSDSVVIRTTMGREVESQPVLLARGAWGAPLTEADIWTKFSGCLIVGGYRGDGRALFDALQHLERLVEPQALMRLSARDRVTA